MRFYARYRFGDSRNVAGKGARGLVALLCFVLAACGAPAATPPPTATIVAQIAPPKATPTTAPTATLAPTITTTSTPPATPLPAATATPAIPTATPSGPVTTIDGGYELGVIKQAYGLIRDHLYKVPDTAVLLKAGLATAADTLAVAAPPVTYTTNADSNFSVFGAAFTAMVKATTHKAAKGDVAHTVIDAFANAVGDLHTYLVSAEEYAADQAQLKGDYTTVGFGFTTTFDQTTGQPIIQHVYRGSPSEQAGLHAGDQVISFNGTAVSQKNWRVIVHETAEGGTGVFVVRRAGTGNVTITATKQQYTLYAVESRVIDRHIGYIAILNFLPNVVDEFDKALADLRQQGVDSWIVDVRDDPGGYHYTEIAARFIKPGAIMGYAVQDRNNKRDERQAEGDPQKLPSQPKLPLVVLINEGSGSSSEIFALAMHDYAVAPLVGTKTAGALGETVSYPLTDGWALFITLDTYVSVKGEKDNTIGVPPDIPVTDSLDDLENNRDPQLDAAIAQADMLAHTH